MNGTEDDESLNRKIEIKTVLLYSILSCTGKGKTKRDVNAPWLAGSVINHQSPITDHQSLIIATIGTNAGATQATPPTDQSSSTSTPKDNVYSSLFL